MSGKFPEKLASLNTGQELLRQKSHASIQQDRRMLLHVETVQAAMDLLDVFRQFKATDEDLKVVQALGLRQFNALASAMTLKTCGYYQNGALILRDVLETVFLVDYFRTDRAAIAQWRMADKQTRLRLFKPAAVRKALDARDGFTSNKRTEMYALFSGLAAHASMEGISMLRPLGGDAHIGPFFDVTALAAGLDEMGRLAVQVGETSSAFFPSDWPDGNACLKTFSTVKLRWFAEFYPAIARAHDIHNTNLKTH